MTASTKSTKLGDSPVAFKASRLSSSLNSDSRNANVSNGLGNVDSQRDLLMLHASTRGMIFSQRERNSTIALRLQGVGATGQHTTAVRDERKGGTHVA